MIIKKMGCEIFLLSHIYLTAESIWIDHITFHCYTLLKEPTKLDQTIDLI